MSFRVRPKHAPRVSPETVRVTAERFLTRQGLNVSRLALLDAAWERLYGHQKRLWTLEAVQKGVLFVKVASSAAAYELGHRAPGMLRELNKQFETAWIKKIEAVPVGGAAKPKWAPPGAGRKAQG